MIVTVTLNPSLDRTIEVPHLVRGAVIRSTREQIDAGGKGINVARALTAHGRTVLAVFPVGGADGQLLVDMLINDGVELLGVAVDAVSRCNVAISEPDGTITKVNSPGGPLTVDELAAMSAAVLACAEDAEWIVIGGSQPPGVPDSYYADLIEMLRPTGVRVAVDTSGAPLAVSVQAGPALVKPNCDELAAATGRSLRTFGDVVAAAQDLRAAGADAVLASLGADGAVLVAGDAEWHGEAPAVVSSTVGAGDALLAGFLSAGADGAAALTVALAWGAAAVSRPGSQLPGPADLRPELVRVHTEIDRARLLTDPS